MKIIEKELEHLNNLLFKNLDSEKNQISDDIKNYICRKSKKLRPSLIFLFSGALNIDIDDKIYSLASAIELIHNATLIHDDIIDNSDFRRGKNSLNKELGCSLSILAGDILLAMALKNLVNCNNIKVMEIFAKALEQMCKGEINQNFTIGKIPSIEQYIKKSEDKTAELYKASLYSLCILSNIKEKEKILSFASNFGIAFQIKDDLVNILQTDKSEPSMSDIYNKIYTLPVIFLNKDRDIKEFSADESVNYLKSHNKYINKTVKLIENYSNKAINSIDFICDNQYKKEIIKLTKNLSKLC